MNPNGFSIKRGTNISEVFIASYLTERDRDQLFNRRDVKQIARMGMDHVRIPISEDIMWSVKGTPNPKAFNRLERIITESLEGGLRVILCMHGLRSHPIFGDGVPTLFSDPGAVDQFVGRWVELSARLSAVPLQKLAYELLNEPRAPTDEQWNRVLERVYRAIRECEAERSLLFGSNFYQVPERVKHLFLPDDDPNIIRTFHLYYPTLLTHYRASWLRNGEYKGPIQYPGRPIPSDYIKDLIEPLGSHMGQNNNPVSRIVFAKVLKDANRSIGETSHPIHCGEFGCIDAVPLETRKRWYADVTSALDDDGIPWTSWDWKGNFGILSQKTWRPSGVQEDMGLKTPKWSSAQRPHLSLKSRVIRRLRRYAWRLGIRRSTLRSLLTGK